MQMAVVAARAAAFRRYRELHAEHPDGAPGPRPRVAATPPRRADLIVGSGGASGAPARTRPSQEKRPLL